VSQGKLILISTPIGNLSDISARAIESLRLLDYIVAEDTRALLKLLSLLEIAASDKTIRSFHEHNRGASAEVIARLESGADVGLVSDAGSPILSDPAYPLVQDVLASGGVIDTIPGVSSVTAALELSGLAPHPFSFIGFLPRETDKKLASIASWCELGTLVCFESPHRVERTLSEISQAHPELSIAVVREITKKFQSVHRFRARDWQAHKEALTVKGEFVLVLAREDKAAKASVSSAKLQGLAEDVLKRPSPKATAKLLSEILGLETKEVYKVLTEKNRE